MSSNYRRIFSGLSSDGPVKSSQWHGEKSIEFRDVSFRLADGRTLLSDLNLEISRGETSDSSRAQRFRQDHDDEADQPLA